MTYPKILTSGASPPSLAMHTTQHLQRHPSAVFRFVMSLEITAAQLCETGATWFCMSVLLPIANRCRARYSDSGSTAWCFFHSKEESRLHGAAFLTLWALGSLGAVACWAFALAAYIGMIPAAQYYAAFHGSLALLVTSFEVHLPLCSHERR